MNFITNNSNIESWEKNAEQHHHYPASPEVVKRSNMEKVINNRVTYYALFAIGLFVLFTIAYCTIGVNNDRYWWVADKINDRLFAFNLLFITSFVFRDFAYRLFVYNAMLYIVFYCSYEVCFILELCKITPDLFVWISLLYWLISSILFLTIYVSKRNNE